MNTATIHYLLAILVFLIFLSAFFSAAEIGMMSLNRYRLRHLVRKRNPGAKRASDLLKRPDRLLGIILIGNNFANIFASSVATILAVHFYGDVGVAVATILLTLTILIFAEIMPKTLAAIYPEQIAFRCALILKFLLRLLYPLVWVINGIVNGLLRIVGVKFIHGGLDTLSHEELHTVVREAAGKNIAGYQRMLVSILDLEKATVEDIMIPRSEIIGINIEDEWQTILNQLTITQHTRVPIYRESIDRIEGMLHLRKALNLLAKHQLTKNSLLEIADEVYFVPEGTSLSVQLINFQQKKIRSAVVVDEYGDIQGLITLEDILEEVIGEFTTNLSDTDQEVRHEKNDSYLVGGGITIRELNRIMHWEFPTTGPRTLSGLIVEYLETLPSTGVGLRLAGYPIEIIEVQENTVKTARIWPKLRQVPTESTKE